MSDDPYVKVNDDGTVQYRASSLGGCDLALLAARLGYDVVPIRPDAPIMQVFAAGHRIEEEVLAQREVSSQQKQVWMQVTRRIFVIGHIDGIEGDYIDEVKSQNQEEWDRFAAHHWDGGFFPKYKWQVSVYMHALNMPLRLIRALRDKEGNWTGEVAVSHVDEPFYSEADIRERVLRTEAAAATGVLSAECSPVFPCPYFYLHDEIDRELIDDEGVEILAKEYAAAQQLEALAKGMKANTRKALRIACETDKVTTPAGVKITFYESLNPPTLDKELLEGFLKLHNRTLDEYMKRGKSERLRVTMPRDET